jgi:excisionase family DNA binding protein
VEAAVVSGRLIVDAAALARLVAAAADRPHPDLRAALVALVSTGTAPAPDRRPWLSPAEAAELLGVSLTTVRRRIADGTIPASKLGQLWRIPTGALTNGRQRSPTVATHDDGADEAGHGDPHDEEHPR